ncbi:hypothetical protein APHAL10511_003307 [Amanita phalloides]|nr:hypothetical protein APHAL10511_003307 [Amanita phalloides]
MSQPPEKAYTPPGAAAPQVPGQYNQYAQGQGQEQPGQYPQGQPPPPQYGQPPFPPTQYAQPPNPNPQYQQPPTGQPPQGQGPPQGQQYQPYPQVQYAQYPNVQQPPPAAQYMYAQPQITPYPQQQQQPYPVPHPFQTFVVQQQPMPVVGMSVVGSGNRNVKNLPRDATGRREWSFGLCSCFDDCGTCVLGMCCPCMLYAQLKNRVDYLNAYGTPDPSRGGSGVDLNCLVWVGLHAVTGCGCVLQAINRGNIRNRYMIEGDGFTDFCVAGWCPACELTQEHRELDQEEQSMMK